MGAIFLILVIVLACTALILDEQDLNPDTDFDRFYRSVLSNLAEKLDLPLELLLFRPYSLVGYENERCTVTRWTAPDRILEVELKAYVKMVTVDIVFDTDPTIGGAS